MADTFDLTIRAITPFVGADDLVNYAYDVDITHKVDGVATAKYPRTISMPATVTTPASAREYGQAVVDDLKKSLAFTRDPKKPGDSAPQLAVGSTFTLS
jgi:hypothetical protein